MINYKMSRYYM